MATSLTLEVATRVTLSTETTFDVPQNARGVAIHNEDATNAVQFAFGASASTDYDTLRPNTEITLPVSGRAGKSRQLVASLRQITLKPNAGTPAVVLLPLLES